MIAVKQKKKRKQKFEANSYYELPYGPVYIPPNRVLDCIFPVTLEEARRTEQWALYYSYREETLNKKLTHMLGQADKPNPWGAIIIFRTISYKKVRNKKAFYRVKSWLDGCFSLKANKQVTCGGSLSTRDVVIADIDDSFPGFDAIYEKCKEERLPVPSYILVHELTNHYQLGYILEEPFACAFWGRIKDVDTKEKDLYNRLIDAVGLAWGGDPNFTGCWCKNPCCDHDIQTEFTGEIYKKEDLLKIFAVNTEEVKKITIKKRKIRKRDEEDLKTAYDRGVIGSRNCHGMKKVIEYTFAEKSKGRIPSDDEVIAYMMQVESEFLKSPLNTQKKTEIENYNEIRATALSAKKWAIEHFNKRQVSSSRFDDEAREKSLITRKVKQKADTLLCLALKSRGLTIGEISKELDIGKSTVTYDVRTVEVDLKNDIRKLVKYYRHYEYIIKKDEEGYILTDQEKNILQNLIRIIEVLKKYYFMVKHSSSSYYNKYIEKLQRDVDEILTEISYNIRNKNLKGNGIRLRLIS